MMHRNVALIASVLAVCCCVGVHSASDPVGSIAWNDVPASSVTTPATSDYSSLDLGKCMCDYTPYVCDASCCCDPDCPLAAPGDGKPAFFPTCDRANGGDNQKLRCMPETVSGIEIVSARTAELRRQEWFGQSSVCVVDTNLAAREGIEPLYTLPTATDAAAALVTPPNSPWPRTASSASGAAAATGSSTTTTANSFAVGDLIPLASFDAFTYASSVNPAMQYVPDLGATVPNGGAVGVCDTANQNDHLAGFMQSTQSGDSSDTVACDVQGASLATLCAAKGRLNVDQFRYLGIVGKDHDLSSRNLVVPIQLRIVDATTMTLLEQYSTATVVDRSFDAAAAAPAAPTVITSVVGVNCINAVVGTRLTIEYNQATDSSKATSISGASLVVLVNPNLAPSAMLRYRRSFSVRYVQKGSVAAGLNNDRPSSLTRRRAGSPGYVAGRPIVAGYQASNGADKTAVFVAPAGFSLPIGGNCLANTRFGTVPFDHNVSNANCYMTITETDLNNNYCVNGGVPTLLDVVLKPAACGGVACAANVTIFDRIGRDGSARYNVSADWIAVADATRDAIKAAETLVANSKRTGGMCSGIVTGLHWTFGIMRAGATYNPQDVIVAAKVKPIIGTWTPPRVRFSFKVSFVRLDDRTQPSAAAREVKAPPFFPAVDQDIFYPFKRPNA